MMNPDSLGLYVHIPFCVKKCNYCDFASFAGASSARRREYIDALIREIKSYSEFAKPKLDTVFFGGGTPSVLSPSEFLEICNVINSVFDILPNAEFTVEANPCTVNEEKLLAFNSCGVNRLSLGLQSIHKNELKMLGRIHDYDTFLKAFEMARKCGFDNISVDLMYGIPEQTRESFEKTLESVIKLRPEHISAYGLILEEGTVLYDMKDMLTLPTEDEECDMYFTAAEKLRLAGYQHYEISNYSIGESYRCLHNMRYWMCREYIGVGLAAHSFYNGRRYGNGRVMSEYLTDPIPNLPIAASSVDELAFEYAMLALRTCDGFFLSDYKRLFGAEFLSERRDVLDGFIRLGYAELSDGRLRLTEKGFYVSNFILSELL